MPPEVIKSYERAFQQALEGLIERTKDPHLRAKLQAMRDCPIRVGNHCQGFAEYIVSALIRHGVGNTYDLEAALSYIFSQMMMDRSLAGTPKRTLFGDFDETLPAGQGGNPLEARFKTWLANAVRNVAGGRIPSLRYVERRPGGTVSIAPGRPSDSMGSISADEIPGRQSSSAETQEMIDDLRSLLRAKELACGLPLGQLFADMLAGDRVVQQRARYGDRRTRMGRQLIIQTLKDYAESSGNEALRNLLQRFESGEPTGRQRPEIKPARPELTPQDQDFTSIASVVRQLGRPVGTADLGRLRRRWLEFPPRDPSSPHSNRMDDTLARMVDQGVLQVARTGRGAVAYAPGPHFERYVQ